MIDNRNSQTKQTKIVSTFIATIICILLLFMLFATWVEISALHRGYEGNTSSGIPFQLHVQNQRNHIVNRAYEPTPGDIVIYVRYGCPLCEVLYDEICDLLRAHDNIYIVGTRTDAGLALREDYPISVVPSAVLIGSNLPYIPLAIEGPSGSIVLDRYGFNLLLAERGRDTEGTRYVEKIQILQG